MLLLPSRKREGSGVGRAAHAALAHAHPKPLTPAGEVGRG
jgi:hypothetical protein